MSSVINEIARTTKYPCRAKNPATCRVHGTFEPLAVIMDSAAAKRNLRNSEAYKTQASSFEDRVEAEMLYDKDQLLYDATLAGLQDLESAYWAAKRNADRLQQTQIENRIEVAKQYRDKVLADSPVLQKINDQYEQVINQPGAKTVRMDNGRIPAAEVAELKATSYGTPVVLKLKNGGIIYDTAGDGIIGGYENLGRFEKLLNRKQGFLTTSYPTGDQRDDPAINLHSSDVMINPEQVESITVLPADATMPDVTADLKTLESEARSSGYRAVIGADFTYLGDMLPDRWTDSKGKNHTWWRLEHVSVSGRPVEKVVAIPLT